MNVCEIVCLMCETFLGWNILLRANKRDVDSLSWQWVSKPMPCNTNVSPGKPVHWLKEIITDFFSKNKLDGKYSWGSLYLLNKNRSQLFLILLKLPRTERLFKCSIVRCTDGGYNTNTLRLYAWIFEKKITVDDIKNHTSKVGDAISVMDIAKGTIRNSIHELNAWKKWFHVICLISSYLVRAIRHMIIEQKDTFVLKN